MPASDSEIKAVAYILKQDHEGKTADQVAAECIKALRSLEATATRQMMGPMVVGEVFRTPLLKNPMIVAHAMNDETTWIVNKADTYGLAVYSKLPSWSYREPARMTDAVKSKALTNVAGHMVNDMFMQGGSVLTVVATCMNGLLLHDGISTYPESNEHLKRFYSKVEV